ncbi:hypothetical protein DRW41_04735 [Neobacillus piezotolerans]|uniref:Uncharacterized protein n=1 Tax=Neobacillus piezotolerans TaxID=2259171 RepID=A0A3D8GWN4_9BACI|nr:hypothetical protein [Neobacillus piezotolerans]RDU38867.1 hypothetical protein DRW41_04735 [Neobacillus piezotolerans]
MKLKSFIVALSALVGTAGILYLIGHIFEISPFMFHYDFTSDSGGFNMAAGSFLPVLIGLLASFVAEKYYLHKAKAKLG